MSRQRWRTALRMVAVVLLALIAVAGAGAFGIRKATSTIYTPPSAAPAGPVARPDHDPARPTVVVVLARDGANVADTLAPYEVFAMAGGFNVHTVAAGPDPVPLTGGLDVRPDLTFAGLADLDPDGPEVVIVPQLSGIDDPVTDPVSTWLRSAHAGGSLVMSVCVGAGVLADAGLLDGRPATSHWLGLIGLRRDHPQVDWTDGVRFVDDGDVITTAGVLSGIDGSLRVVERFHGPTAAARLARDLHWAGYPAGKQISPSAPAAPDVVGLLGAGFRWDRPRAAVLLTDGVGEIELAAAFRPFTELSYLSTLIAVSRDGQPIRSRHGLTFLPRADAAATATADRVLVPGVDAAAARAGDDVHAGGPVVYLNAPGEFAFDGALRDIAVTYDVATARWVGKTLQYPTDGIGLTGPQWPWELTARPLLIATTVVLGLYLLRRLRFGTTAPPT